GGIAGAMELAFRLDAAMPRAQYFCNWEPYDGNFLVETSDANANVSVLVLKYIDPMTIPNYDPKMYVTMHVNVAGSTIHCWLEEVTDADITLSDPTHATGTFGVKTYAMGTAFDFVRVYSVP